MTTYNTGNALGSSDPRDLYDNAENLDNFANGPANTYPDRLGVTRRTIAGMASAFDSRIASLGYDLSLGDYGAGKTITDRGQVVLRDGEYYKAAASATLPLVLTGTWGTDSGKLVGVGDGVLRQELVENANDFGLLPEIANYAALRSYTGPVTAYHVRGVANVFDGGSGIFRVDATDTTTADNGGTVLVDAAGRRWKRDVLGPVDVRWFGATGDPVADEYPQLQSAIASLYDTGGVVNLAPTGARRTYRTSEPLELSNTSTSPRRHSVALIGPACIKPLSTFSGNQVIQHTQLPIQAAGSGPTWSFGYGANLFDIEVDGSALPPGTVHGIRFDGAWQPVWRNVHVHDMPGNGWHVPADNSISATGDDAYANITPTLIDCKFTANGGHGIFQSRFGAPFVAINTYVNNNALGGVRITAPNVTWVSGAIGYNAGVGLHFARSESAITSQLSNCSFVSVEIDRNAVNNIWFEHAYNCSIERPRLITGETGPAFGGGSYITPVMVRFGGTPGQSAFNNRIVQPYVRDSQQTTNPALTLYDFTAQSSDCEVVRQYRLIGGTSNVTIGTTAGLRNFVSNESGLCVFGNGVPLRNGYAGAHLTAATTITTSLADVIFGTEALDQAGRYDPASGIYSFGNDNGVFIVKGFLTVDAAAATTDRTITIHLRYDSGTGTFSSLKICTVQVNGTSLAQLIPFDFMVPVVSQNARVKIAAVASTGTALTVGSQTTAFAVYRA